jgi:hypothetical protein
VLALGKTIGGGIGIDALSFDLLMIHDRFMMRWPAAPGQSMIAGL